MILAVVRSHYGDHPDHLNDGDKIYRASNALAEWLGLGSWVDVVAMQLPQNVESLRTILLSAK